MGCSSGSRDSSWASVIIQARVDGSILDQDCSGKVMRGDRFI